MKQSTTANVESQDRDRLLWLIPGAAGLMMVLLMIFVGVFADVITPRDPLKIEITDRLKPPFFVDGGSTEYLLGTDKLGRDVLSRVILSARIGGILTAIALVLVTALGLPLGLAAGALGARSPALDAFVRVLTDTWSGLAFLGLGLTVIAIFGTSFPVLLFSLVLVILPHVVRLFRGLTIGVLARRNAAGNGISAVPKRSSILHWALGTISIIAGAWALAWLLLGSMSFLGLGVQPPNPSWGSMLAYGREQIATAWWLALFPGLALFVVIGALSMVSFSIQRVLPPIAWETKKLARFELIGIVVRIVVAIWLVISIPFILLQVSGDPVALLVGENATRAQVVAMREKLGVGQPIPVQYARHVSRMVTLDFSSSLVTKRSALQMTLDALPNSLLLATVSVLIAILLAIPLGLLSARIRRSRLKGLWSLLAAVWVSVPLFWAGIVLILIFAVNFRLLPSFGAGTVAHLILPVLVLVPILVAILAPLFRSGIDRALERRWVQQSRGETTVPWLPAAFLASAGNLIVSFLHIGRVLPALIVVETVIGWPGMGGQLVQAISLRDYPVVEATFVVMLVLSLGSGILIDVVLHLREALRGGPTAGVDNREVLPGLTDWSRLTAG